MSAPVYPSPGRGHGNTVAKKEQRGRALEKGVRGVWSTRVVDPSILSYRYSHIIFN